MHPLVTHQWACLVLLYGLTTTLALPVGDDDLFAFAPPDNLNTFTSDTLPIDGGFEPLPFGDVSQDSIDYLDFGNDPLLGYDPSIGSGFDVAYAEGDCKLGEVVQKVDAVAFSSAGCPATKNLQGCSRPGSSLTYSFDSRLPGLCSVGNQQCCSGTSSKVFDALTDCEPAPQPKSAVQNLVDFGNSIGNTVGDAWDNVFPANPGAGTGPSFNPGGLFGIGDKKKKRSDGFCALPPDYF